MREKNAWRECRSAVAEDVVHVLLAGRSSLIRRMTGLLGGLSRLGSLDRLVGLDALDRLSGGALILLLAGPVRGRIHRGTSLALGAAVLGLILRGPITLPVGLPGRIAGRGPTAARQLLDGPVDHVDVPVALDGLADQQLDRTGDVLLHVQPLVRRGVRPRQAPPQTPQVVITACHGPHLLRADRQTPSLSSSADLLVLGTALS